MKFGQPRRGWRIDFDALDLHSLRAWGLAVSAALITAFLAMAWREVPPAAAPVEAQTGEADG
ncbi:MAG: hypothetical protein ABL883_07515 [Terricaulis sp.]